MVGILLVGFEEQLDGVADAGIILQGTLELEVQSHLKGSEPNPQN